MARHKAKAGKRFEARVAEVNEFLLANGLAYMFKVPDPIKVLRKDKSGKIFGVTDKPAYADFAGMLATGQFVGFEAKRTEHKSSWSFSNISDFSGLGASYDRCDGRDRLYLPLSDRSRHL